MIPEQQPQQAKTEEPMTDEEALLKIAQAMKDNAPTQEDKQNVHTFLKKVGKAQKKKNYVTLLHLFENSKAKFKKVRIDDQTFMEEGIPRLAAAGYVWQEGRKNNPLIILPNFSVKPINAEDVYKPITAGKLYKESLKDGSNVVGYRLLLNKMKLEAIGAKKQMGGMIKWILGAIVLGIIAYAFISGGGV